MRELEESRSHSAPSSRRRPIPPKRTRVIIHVYDLLQPGKLSSLLWHIGGGLLHSGVVVGSKEFAYGGHEEKGVTGVYWNHPREEPPGCTFRTEVHQGWTTLDTQGVDAAVRELSHSYLGTDWNLLTRNCNHFTAALCRKLTGKGPPCWLNRAATIGITLPCMIPKDVLSMTVPDVDNAEGALVEDESAFQSDDDDFGERRPILRSSPAKGSDRHGKVVSVRQTSWYDDDDDNDDYAEDYLFDQENLDTHAQSSKSKSKSKPSSRSRSRIRSRSNSMTGLLPKPTSLARTLSLTDMRGGKSRARMKFKDGSGRIVRVSARVP